MTVRLEVAPLLAQLRGRGDKWWGFSGEPTREEITRAMENGEFEEERNDGDRYPGDRGRHVRRIAYLCAHPKGLRELDEPVEIVNGVLVNGAHRVLAAHFLGRAHVDAACSQTTAV